MDDKKNFSQGCSMLVSGVLVGDLVILNALLFAMWHYFGNVAYGFPLKTFVTSSIAVSYTHLTLPTICSV